MCVERGSALMSQDGAARWNVVCGPSVMGGPCRLNGMECECDSLGDCSGAGFMGALARVLQFSVFSRVWPDNDSNAVRQSLLCRIVQIHQRHVK